MAIENLGSDAPYDTVYGDVTHHGAIMAEILRHAVEKYNIVSDLRPGNIPRNPQWSLADPWRSTRQRPVEETAQWIEMERARQEEKLRFRKLDADKFVGAGLVIRLSDVATQEVTGEGELVGLSLSRAAVLLAEEDGHNYVRFAQKVPSPNDVRQTYYGTRLTAAFDVLQVPDESAWLFRD